MYSAVAAVLLAVPGAAQALTVTASLSPKNADGTVNGAATVFGTCSASLSGMSGESFASGTATVSGGTFAGSATTATLSAAVSTLSISSASTGTLTLSCTITANRLFGGPTTVTATTSATIQPPAAAAPEIASISPELATVLVSSVQPVSVVASDPAGLALTYAWTSTGGGTFADPTAASTEWTAPATQGSFTLTVTVTNSAGMTASQSAIITTALSLWQGGLSAAMRYPRRVAATPSGELLVVDDLGKLFLLTKRGDLRGSIDRLGATAVTVGDDVAYVATKKSGILKVDPATGRLSGVLSWRPGVPVAGMAWDSARGLLWVALGMEVVGVAQDGSVQGQLTQAEGRGLLTVADVALDARDPAAPILWVAERDGMTGNRVHAFNPADGSYLRSMVTAGTSVGQVVDAGGLAVGTDGRVYVSDAYNVVQVMTSTGTAVGTIGQKGNVDGYLLHPRGLAFMANGDLAIANSWFNRVERFGSGAALPTCAGDSDCDGLPDDWELAAGLDPYLASDALLDLDRDGLNNAEELALGTDPTKADTDGDGFSDRDELLAGFDPLDGTDHRPTLVAGNSGKVPPGLVRLSATVGNASNCVASWKQVSGSSVTLRDADSFAPSFVARAAGTFKFEGVAMCGAQSSAPSSAQVEVANVPPMADAGRLIVTAPGRTVQLNAGFSSDANGEPLTFTWEQPLGSHLAVSSRGSVLSVRPTVPGYYLFELTAKDKAEQTSSSTVGVVCVDDTLPTAQVATALLTAATGASVTLDASASLPAGATFAWNQVEGSSVGAIAAVAAPAVTLPASGRYTFEVTVTAGGVSSPPARVVVLAGEGGALPVAVASAPSTGSVNGPFTLDAGSSAGSGTLTYAWRQIAGPAAGLSAADGAVVTAVPFVAGVYVFELAVADGTGAVSAPATVRVDVPAAGKALPVAAVTAPTEAILGELVILNGKASTGAARYRWSQVGGPWVGIDTTSATPVFTAPSAGAYRFELVVDDGTVRSAPAAVTVNVQ